jgi:hypothetical protein
LIDPPAIHSRTRTHCSIHEHAADTLFNIDARHDVPFAHAKRRGIAKVPNAPSSTIARSDWHVSGVTNARFTTRLAMEQAAPRRSERPDYM